MQYDINKIREDFPILSRTVYDKPLIYLDNAATTQKPKCVVDALVDEYYSVNANVHRGVHYLSQQATDLHEAARETVRAFINARSTNEIVFTRGTTESINLIASSFARYIGISRGDEAEVIVSTMEHHSNIVPWQLNGFKVKAFTTLDEFRALINSRTRIVSVTSVSNVLGERNPISEIINIAHANGIPVLVDGAQSTPHFETDVQAIDSDFYVFSGHKLYGPTGIGILYGKEDWLDKLPPYQGGGEMIKTVTFENTTFEELPFKFEAGTPDYIATHGLAKAIDYLNAIGLENIAIHEATLRDYCVSRLKEIDGLTIYGNPQEAVISFNLDGIHHLDVGTLLDRLGIAVRTGHHCAQPLMQRLGVEGTVRASFALYNTKEEIDTLVAGLQRVKSMF
ncbi:MAG: cysteine desulfurase [Prevotellaceae bacterium]|nr:cysteine desulfurase [Prevotellaceae bacterium]